MKELYAYLSLVVCEMVVKLAKRKCLGCLHDRRIALNHGCEQISLLSKFELHYDTVVAKVTENLKTITTRFVTLFPVYANQDEACYSSAQKFLEFSTHRSIYYGGYCEDEDLYKVMIDALRDSTIARGAETVCKSPKRAAEKSKAPLKRQRKIAPAAAPAQQNIEKVLADAYDELYGSTS